MFLINAILDFFAAFDNLVGVILVVAVLIAVTSIFWYPIVMLGSKILDKITPNKTPECKSDDKMPLPSFCTGYSYPTTAQNIYHIYSQGLKETLGTIWRLGGRSEEYKKSCSNIDKFIKQIYHEDIGVYYAEDELVTQSEQHKLEPRLLSIYFKAVAYSYYKIYCLQKHFVGYKLQIITTSIAQTLIDMQILRQQIDSFTGPRLADSEENLNEIIEISRKKAKSIKAKLNT